jgi:5-methylcytosine-specific restriction enzyme subunit McrC
VVLRKGNQTYIIDTKWKRPNRSAATVNDLRQMYTYCRFWDAEKALLLYPGERSENTFKRYLTEDYLKDSTGNHNEIEHQCKMGFVEVMKGNELNPDLGFEILNLMRISEEKLE